MILEWVSVSFMFVSRYFNFCAHVYGISIRCAMISSVTTMNETVNFGLTTGDVKRKFEDLVKNEGSMAAAITSLLNR